MAFLAGKRLKADAAVIAETCFHRTRSVDRIDVRSIHRDQDEQDDIVLHISGNALIGNGVDIDLDRARCACRPLRGRLDAVHFVSYVKVPGKLHLLRIHRALEVKLSALFRTAESHRIAVYDRFLAVGHVRDLLIAAVIRIAVRGRKLDLLHDVCLSNASVVVHVDIELFTDVSAACRKCLKRAGCR